ncbi:MAG TPA: carbonic anhydrase [Blastocatellia bacterium]|nr:carbonic anhydrase [Blastocatellia bacterium]
MPSTTVRIGSVARFFLLPCLLLLCAIPALTEEELPGHLALSRLLSGNERFVSGRLRKKDLLHERPVLAEGQHPYAIILSCADSRVPPELVFDESLGRLFTVRVAGNVADPAVLGSIEYAVEHLHVRLLMVMGHDSCGAVKATMSGGELPPNIKALVSRIKPAVDKVWTQGIEEKTRLDAAIRENVHYQMQSALYESDILSSAVHRRELLITGAVYHLNSGRVELLPTEVAVERRFPDDEGNATEEHGAEKASVKETKGEEHDAEAANEKPHAPARPRQSAPVRPAATQHSAAPKAPASPKADEHRKPEPAREGKKAEHGDEHQPAPEKTRKASLESTLRTAYENDQKVMLRKSMLMRDSRDGCATEDCRSIPAGEVVRLENPLVLNIMGRPQVKVRYKGRSVYITADETALAVVSQ